MNFEDPMAAFNGKGNISPSPEETNSVILIQTNNVSDALVIVDSNSSVNSQSVVVSNFVIPGSNIADTDFTFEGVRTSVFAQSSGNAMATPSPSVTNAASAR
jgi:hypothetical protein